MKGDAGGFLQRGTRYQALVILNLLTKKRKGCSFFNLSFDETVSISSWRPGSIAKPHEHLNEGQRMSGLLIDSSASSRYSGPRWSAA